MFIVVVIVIVVVVIIVVVIVIVIVVIVVVVVIVIVVIVVVAAIVDDIPTNSIGLHRADETRVIARTSRTDGAISHGRTRYRHARRS